MPDKSGYKVVLPVDYKLLHGGLVVETGHGRTAHISRGRVLVESGRPLTPGVDIELSIAWPAPLNGLGALTLRVDGRTAGTQGGCTAVHITGWAATLDNGRQEPTRSEPGRGATVVDRAAGD